MNSAMRAMAILGICVFCYFAAAKPLVFEGTPQKTWTKDEINQVQAAMRRFKDLGLENFLKKIQANGFVRIIRHDYHKLSDSESASNSPLGWVAWVSNTQKTINFTDTFFITDLPMNSAFGLTEFILFHELVHAFVNGNPDLVAEFATFANFEHKKSLTKFGTPMGAMYVGALLEMSLMRAADDWVERTLAISRRTAKMFQVPTLYALNDPAEFIAEMATYTMLDPEADKYIPAETREWLFEKILD